MMKKYILAIFLFSGILSLEAKEIPEIKLPPKERFLLVLMIGQSNMAGRGKPTEADRITDPRILKLDRSGKWVVASVPVHYDKNGAGTCLGSTFARRLLADNPDAVIGLIPAACGGSSLADWQPGKFFSQTRSYPFDDALIRTRLGCKDGTLKAILWHQGEADLNPTSAPVYKEKLRKIILRLRAELNAENIPVIFGALAKDPAVYRHPLADVVDRAQKELSNELLPAGYSDSTGLKLLSDRLHFDRESLIIFGNRYYESYLKTLPQKQK